MEIRAQVAYHFKIDPAKLTPGRIQLPEQITRTISVGEELQTEKVSLLALSLADRAAITTELQKLTVEATRTARPAGTTTTPGADAAEEPEELNAF